MIWGGSFDWLKGLNNWQVRLIPFVFFGIVVCDGSHASTHGSGLCGSTLEAVVRYDNDDGIFGGLWDGLTESTVHPISLVVVVGAGQRAVVHSTLPIDPVVMAIDSNGQPISGLEVHFSVDSGGGAVQTGVFYTDTNGHASPGWWRLSTRSGANRLLVYSGDSLLNSDTLILEATGVPGSAVQLQFIGVQPDGVSGIAWPAPLMAEAVDTFGNRDTSFRRQCTLYLLTADGSFYGQFNPITVTTDTGLAIWTGLMLHRALDSVQWMVYAPGIDSLFGHYFRILARGPTGLSLGVDSVIGLYGDTLDQLVATLLDDGGGTIHYRLESSDASSFFVLDSVSGSLNILPHCPAGVFRLIVSAVNQIGSCTDTLMIQILPAPLLVRVLHHSKVYGDSLDRWAAPGDPRVGVTGLRQWDSWSTVRLHYSGSFGAHRPIQGVGSYQVQIDSIGFQVGTEERNYQIIGLSDSVSISPARLEVTGLVALTKVYNDSNDVLVLGNPEFVGLVNQDQFSVNGQIHWYFNNPQVGEHKPLVRSGTYSIASPNYWVQQPELTSSISTRTLRLSLIPMTKEYGDSFIVHRQATELALVNGLQGDDQLDALRVTVGGIPSGHHRRASVGQYSIFLDSVYFESSLDWHNYIFETDTGILTVYPAPLSIQGLSALSKVYDGTEMAGVAGVPVFYGLKNDDILLPEGHPTWLFQDADVGVNKIVQPSNHYSTSSFNYVVVQPILHADIFPRALTLGGTRPADGTAWASHEILQILNLVPGDELILGFGQARIDSVYPGNRIVVSSGTLTLSGSSSSNYTLNGISGQVLITPRVIRLTGNFEVEAKEFDGSTHANLLSVDLQFDNLIPGFFGVFMAQPIVAFKSEHIGVLKRVGLIDFQVNGADLVHYAVDRSSELISFSSIIPNNTQGSMGGGNNHFGDSSHFLDGSNLIVGLNMDVNLMQDSVAAGDSLLCGFLLRDIRGRQAEYYQNEVLNLVLFSGPAIARLLTPSYVLMHRGIAESVVAVDRGGTYSILAWFRSPTDSISVISNTFTVSRPTARVGGSFWVEPKAFDGTSSASIGVNQLMAMVLPSDAGLVWIDSIRLEFVGVSTGQSKRVKLVYCVLAGPMSMHYDLRMDEIFSSGEIRPWTGKSGHYGGSHIVFGEASHIDGQNIIPKLNIVDSVLFQSAHFRSGDTISLLVELLTTRNRRADYVSSSMFNFFLLGTPFNQAGNAYLQGETQDTIIRGCSPRMSLWIGKGGENLRLGAKSFVDGVWMFDTSVSFVLMPPFLRLGGAYRVADKAYDGNTNAHVSDFSNLRGMVDLPAPFNDSFPPLACQAAFISASVGKQRRTYLTSIQFEPAIEAAFSVLYEEYGSTGNIHGAMASGGQGMGAHDLGYFGILLDGATPLIQLQWSIPPAIRGNSSNNIRAGDSLFCAIRAFNQRGLMADFFDQIPVGIQIQFSSGTNRLYGNPLSVFVRGEALFPHFTLNRASRVVLSLQWPQSPPFPTAELTSDTLRLDRPLLAITGTFRTCDKIYNGSTEAVFCQGDSIMFHPLPFGNDIIRLQSSRPYYFSPLVGTARRAYLTDTSMVLGDSAIHYEIGPVLLLGYGNIHPPHTRGGNSAGNHILSQQGVFLEGSAIQYSLRVSQQPTFLRLPLHPMIHNRSGDTFQFAVRLFTQRDRIADYSGQLPVRFTALFQSTYPVRVYGDTVKNLSHSVAFAASLAFNRAGSALAVRASAQIPGGQALSCTSNAFILEKAVLNISGKIKDIPKVFDGTTQLVGVDTTGLVYTRLPAISGMMPSDQVYLGQLVLNYRSPAPGTKKKLALSSYTIRGSDSMHYELGAVNPILEGEIGTSANRGGQGSGALVHAQLGFLLDGGSAIPFNIGWLNSPALWGNRAGVPIAGTRSGKPGVGVYNHRNRLLEHLSDSTVLVGVISGHPKNPIAYGSIRIPLNRGYARFDSITLNRGGQGFRLMASLRLGIDSLTSVSDTFNLERPIAYLLGDFQMTTKKYDGNTGGDIFSHSWRVKSLPVGADSLMIQPIEVRFRSPSVGDRKKAVLWSYQISGHAAVEYEYTNNIIGTGVVSEGKFGGSDHSIRSCSTLFRHLDWSPIDSGRIVCVGFPNAQRRAGEMFQFRAELQTKRGKWAEHIDTVGLNILMTQGPVGWQGFEIPAAALFIRGQFSSGFWSVSRFGSYQIQLSPINDQRWESFSSVFHVSKPLSVVSGTYQVQNRMWDGSRSAVVTDISALQASRLPFTQDELTIQSVTAEFLSPLVGLNKRLMPTGLVLGGRDAMHYDVSVGSSVLGRASIFPSSGMGGQASTTLGYAQKAGSFLGDSSLGSLYLLVRPSVNSFLPCGDEIPEVAVSMVNSHQRVIRDWEADVQVLPDFYGNQYRGDVRYFMEAGRAKLSNLRPESSVLVSLGLKSSGITSQLNAPSLQILPCVLGHTSSSHRTARLSGVDLNGQRSVSIGISGNFRVFDKLYDGNRNAQISAFNLQIIGQSPGDQVYLDSIRASFRSMYPGDQKQVILDTSLRLSGRDASKYRLAFFGAPTTTASIVSHSRRGFMGHGDDLNTNGWLFVSGDTAVVAQGNFLASGKEFDGQIDYSGPINRDSITLYGIRPGHQLAVGSLTTKYLSPYSGDDKNMRIEHMQLQGSHASRYRIDRSRLPKGHGPIFAPSYATGSGEGSGNRATDTLFLSDGSRVTPFQIVLNDIRGRSSASNRMDVSYMFTDSLNRSVPWGFDRAQVKFFKVLDSAALLGSVFRALPLRRGGLFGEIELPVYPDSLEMVLIAGDSAGSQLDSQSICWQNQYPGISKPHGSGANSQGNYTLGLHGGTADVWMGGWPYQARNWFEPLNWSRRRIPEDTAQIWIPRRRYQPNIQQALDSGQNGVRISQPGTMRILDGGFCTLDSVWVDSIYPRKVGLLVNYGAEISTEGTAYLNIRSGGNYANLGTSQPNLRVEKQLTGARGWKLIAAPVRSTFKDFLDSVVIQGVSGSDFPNWQPNVLNFLESDTGTHLQSWRTIQTPNDTVVGGRGQAVYVFDGAQYPMGSTGYYRDSLPKVLMINGVEPILNRDRWFNFGTELTYTPRSTYANNQVTPDSIYTDLMESDAGWNLLGNPTSSPLYWDPNSILWQRERVDASIYTWDPSMNNHVGGYRYWNGQTGNYRDTVGGLAVIPPFQAFWIHANAPNPILKFRGDSKLLDQAAAVVRRASPIQIDLSYSIDGMSTQGYVTFEEGCTIGRDESDAYFLPPQGDDWVSLYTLSAPGSFWPLSINSLPVTQTPYRSIPLFVQAGRSGIPITGIGGRIEWNLSDGWPEHWHPVLMDHAQRKAMPMRLHKLYHVEALTARAPKDEPLQLGQLAFSKLKLPGVGFHHASLRSVGANPNLNARWPYSIVIMESEQEPDYAYMPDIPELYPPFPNPTRSNVWFRYFLPETADVRLEVYDMRGRMIWERSIPSCAPGVSQWQFEANGLSTGVYLVKLLTQDQISVQRFVLEN